MADRANSALPRAARSGRALQCLDRQLERYVYRRDFPSRAFKAEGRNAKEQHMFEWTRMWLRLRREHAAMRSGRMIDLFANDETYVFARQLNDETLIIAINRENRTKQVQVPAGSIGVKDGVTFETVIGPKIISRVVNGEAELVLLPQMALAFKAF